MADSDIDDLEILQQNRHIVNVPRVFRIQFDPFDAYSGDEFLQRFRFSKKGVHNLETLLHDELQLVNRSHNITAMQQILLTLRFLATGSFQIVCADLTSVSLASANRAIWRTTLAIAARHRQYIKFPSGDEIDRTKQNFFIYSEFPGVVGAIDCTHVAIINPGGYNAEIYRNRKGYHSINVQMVCDVNLNITNMVIRWPGSTHDSRIFDNSRLRTKFEDGHVTGLLLDDGGYACRYYLMTPFTDPQTPAERRYNFCHKRGRSSIERMFGVWKRRFPCLHFGIRMKLQRTLVVISAAAVLYQLLKLWNVPEPEYEGDNEDDNNDDNDDDAPNLYLPPLGEAVNRRADIRGQTRKRAIVEDCFTN
ncbi:putative nuclease HARBI1 [Gigantopelta aegis]|uniref:putative nuclease HARBI1 n=1 Tax=Gigantopelta aegis TaxID=1735272 RepID=UPI001B88BA11|nr:putative nuclease HARBI1 [Gigantopelta aegis]